MAHINKTKVGRDMTHRGKYIAPGMLGRSRGSTLKSSNFVGFEGILKSSNSMGSGSILRSSNYVDSSNGIFTTHNLIVHFDDAEYHEKNFSEDSCLMDILAICKKFIDINTIGFKITDGEGRPLKDDQDVLFMIEEHKRVKDINIYLDKDETSQPLPFKLPQRNSSLGSYTQVIPKVINVKILGDLKNDKKVVVKGDIIDGSERVSAAQLFILISKEFDNEDDLKPISEPQIDQKEFQISKEAVGRYLVAKYTPMTIDGKIGVPVYAMSDNCVENSETRKVRGKNINKAVLDLKVGEKYPIQFKRERAVGPNQKYWSRHLGKVVRDPTICSVQVLKWDDVTKVEKNHMWDAVKDCFYHPDMEAYKEATIKHMGSLWEKWRSKMNVDYVRPCRSREQAIERVPEDMDPKDWEWLVNNKYLTAKFKEVSDRNSINRSKATKMPHHTGSKPHREIMHQKEEKDGRPPTQDEMFFLTRQKDGHLVEQAAKDKYDEIRKTMQSNPSLTDLEIIEKCFGPQRHGHVFGYGGGIKRKHLESSNSSYIKELEARLLEKDELNCKLQKTIENIVDRLDNIEKERRQSSSVAHSNPNESNQVDA